MDIVAASFIKERTNRAVDETSAENRRISRTTFAAQETAGHLAYSVHFFFIIYSQREEISAFSRFLAGGGRYQYSGITISYQYSTIGLFCHFAGLDHELTAGELHLKCFEQFLFLLIHTIFISNFLII